MDSLVSIFYRIYADTSKPEIFSDVKEIIEEVVCDFIAENYPERAIFPIENDFQDYYNKLRQEYLSNINPVTIARLFNSCTIDSNISYVNEWHRTQAQKKYFDRLKEFKESLPKVSVFEDSIFLKFEEYKELSEFDFASEVDVESGEISQRLFDFFKKYGEGFDRVTFILPRAGSGFRGHFHFGILKILENGSILIGHSDNESERALGIKGSALQGIATAIVEISQCLKVKFHINNSKLTFGTDEKVKSHAQDPVLFLKYFIMSSEGSVFPCIIERDGGFAGESIINFYQGGKKITSRNKIDYKPIQSTMAIRELLQR
jgi:hypothetical protein